MNDWASISRKMVRRRLKECAVCLRYVKKMIKAPIRPIIAFGFWDHIQIDLIDMSSQPGGKHKQYKWILHVRDHWSKLMWVKPLKNKTGKNITQQ